jgi:hypothetical protein
VEPDVPHRKSKQVIQVPLVYPALYNGPVSYYSRLIGEKKILLEQYEHYSKQTYRNRFRILGPNGVLTLSVPVKRKRGVKNYLRDIRIDYDTPWNKIHWRSMVASYASSPFFHYMMDDLVPFYENRIGFLVDLNEGLLRATLSLIGLEIPVERTSSFIFLEDEMDPRAVIHPKLDYTVHDPFFRSVPYHQVFSDRTAFQANLSILDLLFNEGPNALPLLRRSLKI